MVSRTDRPCRVVPYSGLKRQQVDWLELMARRHTVHALLEADVTDTRRALRAFRAASGQPLSLTAVVVGCVARAVAERPLLHAYRKGRGRLVLFDDVDVALTVEHELAGERIPLPHIVRAANRKPLVDVQRDIDAARAGPDPYAASRRWLRLWLWLPPILRRAILTRWLADPHRRQRATGTVIVTPVGMFGSGIGWGIPTTGYTLCVTAGGVARRPALVHGQVEPRELLCLTLSVDHDIVDGAEIGRFAQRLKDLLEHAGDLLVLADAGISEPHGRAATTLGGPSDR